MGIESIEELRRVEALRLAVQNAVPGTSATQIVSKAAEFVEFLSGSDKGLAPDQELSPSEKFQAAGGSIND